MKAMDIVLPPAKTALEDFRRWQNGLQAQLQARPSHQRTQINIQDLSETTDGEVSWGKNIQTSQWVAGVSFNYD